MRINNSIRNSITGSISSLLAMIIGFIAQGAFIKILGAEYMGLNGLFTNILTMLSIFELGIGNAIVYNLYRPIKEENTEEIKSLMKFYKNIYNIIAILILFIGILIIPFLDKLVDEITIDINITLIYIMFLISTITSYIVAYKRSLIYANQKNYIINIVHMFYIVIVNCLQLLMLYFWKNYYVYLFIKIICQLLENIIITLIANKIYPFLLEKEVKSLPKNIRNDVFQKVRALFFHKVGSSVIFGTDNIIISYFFGVTTVGLYTNYSIIINAVNSLFNQFRDSLTASVGNMLITESKEKSFDIFRKIRFINFWLATFSATSLFVITQSFISIWIGEKYLLSIGVLATLCFNYFQKMMRSVYSTFKDSAGIWQEDKFIPFIESIVNIVFSIIFLKLLGLSGVFLGTIVSGLVLWCYSYPKFVYKKLFSRSYIDYIKETLGYIILFTIIGTFTYLISVTVNIKNNYIELCTNIIISLIVPNLLLYAIFSKTENFIYFKSVCSNIVNKLLKKFVKKEKIAIKV
ncbi:lipopolysaccharide biosynthesis protein [Clostridium disporicum]|uniref:Membrane protein involved in the export of O-antigen and teichoic acid n=1 Tax=Clostridium disporicum TaxID=84024 RepID=A0A174L6R4_9CLOT|nr:oligosaccharide flippase family protein [Clostridium disporicum]CUP17485.1 membrane protein involved in the export of O-antigen and teichoic acid [Clostridium disporicum]